MITIAMMPDLIRLVLITVGLLILAAPMAVFATIALIIRSRDKARKEKSQNPSGKNYEPKPGSDADYERWKQEHQNQGENT